MKKSFSSVLMALAFAGSACVAQSAQAGVVDISKAATAVTLTNGGSASFVDSFKRNQKDAIFSEKFTFTTTGWTDLDMIITSTSPNAASGLNLTGFALFDANDKEVLGGKALSTGADDKWQLKTEEKKHLAAGQYYFLVQGNMVSTGGATFAANGSVLSAVPEADTYAMLLAGLGLLGVVARRRNGKPA
jgi:MYXO-CTERM domain-containing protein